MSKSKKNKTAKEIVDEVIEKVYVDDPELNDGDLVEIVVPTFVKTYGQGKPPIGIGIRTGGKRYLIEYGLVVKISKDEKFNPANGVGDFDVKPYPIIKYDFIIKHNIGIEKVNQ